MRVVRLPCQGYTWSAELCYTAIADFVSCKEFEGHGRYIHFCDHANLIRNRKDAFVSIFQNHQRLHEVIIMRGCHLLLTGSVRTGLLLIWKKRMSLFLNRIGKVCPWLTRCRSL